MDRIKESFDSLPIAACFFDKNGVVRLINRRMLAIANWLQKGGIQSLAEMQSALQAPPASVCCLDPRLRIYRFPDGTALRFAQEQITTKAGVRYTQITAADVTELIQKQNQLKAENAKLEKTNKRLKRLLAQMPEIIREEETLAMKLRVHDDIGHSILAARRVLLQHTDLKEIRANAALWERSISVLYRSHQITARSESLEAAKKRAEELGVRVLLAGDEPQSQHMRALSALAICECAANCVRHAVIRDCAAVVEKLLLRQRGKLLFAALFDPLGTEVFNGCLVQIIDRCPGADRPREVAAGFFIDAAAHILRHGLERIALVNPRYAVVLYRHADGTALHVENQDPLSLVVEKLKVNVDPQLLN